MTMVKEISVAAAIANRFVLTLTYDGKVRIVEPHTTGIGNRRDPATALLRAYQTAPEAGWRMFDLSEARDVSITSVKFTPRLTEGYEAGDPAFSKITAQV